MKVLDTVPTRVQFLDSELTAMEPKTRTGLVVATARALVGQPYLHEGRGPVGFDGFGLIRACVQSALDHQTGAFVPVEAIADARGRNRPDPHRPQIQHDEVDANALVKLLAQWGLEAVNYGPGARYTLPGDIKVSLGSGPAGAVVVTGFQPGQTEWVIAAWRPAGPEVRGDCMLGRNCPAVYRWPSHGGVR